MAKTAASVSALQILGVLAACAGVVFVIARSVRTDPSAVTSAAAPLVEQASPQREASKATPAEPVLRSPAAAEPEIPAVAPAVVAGPEHAVSELDTVAETFMSEQPDILGLMGALRTAVRNAKVLSDTVNRSDEDGAVRGEISIAGMEGKASFVIKGMRYRVTFEAAQTARPDRFRRDLAVCIRDDHGQAVDPGVVVQYFPVYKGAVKDLPPEGEQKVMGWGLDALPDGIHAHPMTMRRGAEQGEMIYGRPETDFPRVEPGASDLATFDAWFRMLQPYAK